MPLTSLNPNLLGTDSSGASKLSTAGGLVQLHSTGVFTIANTSANTLFISNTGLVGVGTASPSGKFSVFGDAPSITIQDTSLSRYWMMIYKLR